MSMCILIKVAEREAVCKPVDGWRFDMAELSLRQLNNRRRVHCISRDAVAEKCGCTTAWLRYVEAGGGSVETRAKWRNLYGTAIEALVEEKKAVAR